MQGLDDRLKELTQDLPRGWQAELARRCHVSAPSVNGWVSGASKSIDAKNLFTVADYLGVNPRWLCFGVGSRVPSSSTEEATVFDEQELNAIELANGSSKRERDIVHIPQYDAGGSMGKSLVLQGDQPGIIRRMTVTHEWAQKNLKSHTGLHNLCIVTGFGDSMKPMYNPGDPLILDKGINSCEVDAVYFFRVGDHGFIKRLQRIPGEGIRVISENKAYESWTIKNDTDFEVFGRIMKAWCSEDL